MGGYVGMRGTELERFWKKVKKYPIGSKEYPKGCWIWLGAVDWKNYGRFSVRINGVYKIVQAHRWIYEKVKGEIPKGMESDHLCRVRPCVNLDHLEIVTHKVNILRGDGPCAENAKKIYCIRGHLLDIIRKNEKRECSVCRRMSLMNYYIRIGVYNENMVDKITWRLL